VIFQLLCLIFALLNTTSWFNVTPKAMPMTVGGERVSGSVIVGAHYAAWAGVSLIVILIAGLL
jgi:fumarate reductase subunit C